MKKNEHIEYLLLLQEKRKRELESSFYEFVKDAFEIIHHDEKLTDNWHIKYLCGVLQLEVETAYYYQYNILESEKNHG